MLAQEVIEKVDSVILDATFSRRHQRDEVIRLARDMDANIIFIEWEMTISYKKNPSSVLYGSSRVTLNEAGKIAEQRDYYDLWGDIFDNIPKSPLFGGVFGNDESCPTGKSTLVLTGLLVHGTCTVIL